MISKIKAGSVKTKDGEFFESPRLLEERGVMYDNSIDYHSGDRRPAHIVAGRHYNGFVKLRSKTEEAFSAMDVSLKKRYDLIPNFVETVKGYAKHESETLEKVIAARNMAMTSRTPEETIKNDNVLTGTLKSLFALSEGYPDLKANQEFSAAPGTAFQSGGRDRGLQTVL